MGKDKPETTYINTNAWGIATVKRLEQHTRYKVIYQKSGQITLKPEKKKNNEM